jgi:hypothetical protein
MLIVILATTSHATAPLMGEIGVVERRRERVMAMRGRELVMIVLFGNTLRREILVVTSRHSVRHVMSHAVVGTMSRVRVGMIVLVLVRRVRGATVGRQRHGLVSIS